MARDDNWFLCGGAIGLWAAPHGIEISRTVEVGEPYGVAMPAARLISTASEVLLIGPAD